MSSSQRMTTAVQRIDMALKGVEAHLSSSPKFHAHARVPLAILNGHAEVEFSSIKGKWSIYIHDGFSRKHWGKESVDKKVAVVRALPALWSAIKAARKNMVDEVENAADSAEEFLRGLHLDRSDEG